MNNITLVPSKKESKLPFIDTLSSLDKRQGLLLNAPITIPNYFLTGLGIDSTQKAFEDKIHTYYKELNNQQRTVLFFNGTLPASRNTALVKHIQELFKELSSQGDITLLTIKQKLESSSQFGFVSPYINAIMKVIELYSKDHPHISDTQLKNFVAKIIGWFSDHCVNALEQFLKNKEAVPLYNPILIYCGPIKTHSEYFLQFCWSLGFDVLYLSPSKALAPPLLKNWSQVITWQIDISDFKYPHYKKEKKLAHTPVSAVKKTPQIKTIQSEPFHDPAVIKYKNSSDIWAQLPSSISDRSGFIRGNTPILPVYFYRVIGVQKDQNIYFNDLFKLDRKLKSLEHAYVKFENGISLSNDPSFIKSFSDVWIKYQTSKLTDLTELLLALSKVPAFPMHHKGHFGDLIVSALRATVLEFVADSKMQSISQIKNFIMKLIIWTQDHLVVALNEFDYVQTNGNTVTNPKILYYGNIKKHEAHFLLFASRLGADIIYFNSYEESIWPSLLTEDLLPFKIIFPDKCRIQPFPSKELHLRSETVAYQASKEIESILFDPEGGLFKPWQLDPFKVKSVSLRTTLEEAESLWNIEGRLRPDFEVKEDTVYIPNLFFKLSGVHSTEDAYWQLMARFTQFKNVKLVKHLPFTPDTFSSTDKYLANYIFNPNGLLNIKEVKQKQIFKYGHLKDATQKLILDTINLVLSTKAYQHPIDKNMKKTIVLTLLNLPVDILNLISSFDKPFSIPKLVIFDPDENLFNHGDIATILFLHYIGFDIAIFTPTGYNNIENMIKKEYFDSYRLEDVSFNLELPDLANYKPTTEKNKSFFSSLFGLQNNN